jgi:glycosyltransferase involved in cell wall biosynthesis
MIAYYFPPVGGLGAAGSQRAVRFARYLPAQGWQPVVLTAKESSYESYLTLDPGLLMTVPEALTVIRTGVVRGLTPLLELKARMTGLRGGREAASATPLTAAAAPSVAAAARSRYGRLKDVVTDLFEIPDEQAGWLVPAVAAGLRAVRRHRIDVIYATARPWTALVVGLSLKALTGRRLVVDFRDPWMTNPFRLGHSRVKNRVEAALENRVVRRADLVVANTAHLREEFITRFGPRLAPRCVTIPNGFDPDELVDVKPVARDGAAEHAFVLVHTGFLYGKRDPRLLIDAIARLHDRGLVPRGAMRCELVGPVELSYDLGDVLRRHGLDSTVILHGQLSHAESLAHLAAADLALLLQPGTDTQIPSKLFEYVGMGKPIVAIAKPSSAVSAVVNEHCLGTVADAEDIEAIAAALHESYRVWRERPGDRGLPAETRARFDVRALVGILAAEMTRLVA